MKIYIKKSLWLLGSTVVICCLIYPLIVWAIGRTLFSICSEREHGDRAGWQTRRLAPDRSTVHQRMNTSGRGPRQRHTTRPRPPHPHSLLSNYLLRDRVARMLGPIVKYQSGPKAGQLVAPDIEAWFQGDRYQGNPHLVAQWADNHNELAQSWVSADPSHAQYISDWAKAHKREVVDWIKQNPGTPNPQPPDLAGIFFDNFSKEHPGKFPSRSRRSRQTARLKP